MAIKIIPVEERAKQWEDPANPEKPADARDEEQILRQYKEAKRRKDNLSENQTDNSSKNNKDI